MLWLTYAVYLLTGNYFTLDYFQSEYDRRKIISYNLIESPYINLHQIDPEYFDDGDENDGCFMPLYMQVIWEPKKHDDLLLKIANDELEAFLISFKKNIIVAPYDGGIDFIIWNDKFKKQLKKNIVIGYHPTQKAYKKPPHGGFFKFSKSHLQRITQNQKDQLQAQNHSKQLPSFFTQCRLIHCFICNCFNHVITSYMSIDTEIV